jgi:zinc D-Ala-D-Ala carboxypeptidase
MTHPDQLLSPNFRLSEFLVSQTASRQGIDNTPPKALMPRLVNLAKGLERVRALTGSAIIITSGYRSAALNKAVGGSHNSQHSFGEAADIICPRFGTALDLAELIELNQEAVGFDQLILEFGRWVHISFVLPPRQQILTIKSKEQGYLRGIIP